MIARLNTGMRVRLPSGNTVLLMRRIPGGWACLYASVSLLRGEVEFSGAWLRRVGVRVRA